LFPKDEKIDDPEDGKIDDPDIDLELVELVASVTDPL